MAEILTVRVGQSLFTGGRLSGNLAARKAMADGALHQYLETLLLAFKDVEDGLARLKAAHSRHAFQQSRVAQLTERLSLKERQIAEGLAAKTDIQTLQMAALQAEQAQLTEKVDVLIGQVGLYKALGGGF